MKFVRFWRFTIFINSGSPLGRYLTKPNKHFSNLLDCRTLTLKHVCSEEHTLRNVVLIV